MPQDFGVTPEQVERLLGKDSSWSDSPWVVPILFGAIVAMVIGGASHSAAIFWVGLVVLLGTGFVSSIIEVLKRRHPLYDNVKLYKEAEAAYQRTLAQHRRMLAQHWMQLSAANFEKEVGLLYTAQGYRVESTGGAGDGGIDLVLRKEGETVIVQCKAHNTPIGPGAVRELYGTLMAANAHQAILVSTAGFTQGARSFALGKPIRLVWTPDFIAMAEGYHDTGDPEKTVGIPDTLTPNVRLRHFSDAEISALVNQPRQHYCKDHGVNYEKFQRGNNVWYSHRLSNGRWCREKPSIF